MGGEGGEGVEGVWMSGTLRSTRLRAWHDVYYTHNKYVSVSISVCVSVCVRVRVCGQKYLSMVWCGVVFYRTVGVRGTHVRAMG